jgi:hypothetical protein
LLPRKIKGNKKKNLRIMLSRKESPSSKKLENRHRYWNFETLKLEEDAWVGVFFRSSCSMLV